MQRRRHGRPAVPDGGRRGVEAIAASGEMRRKINEIYATLIQHTAMLHPGPAKNRQDEGRFVLPWP
jgi:hypothetical protein